MACAPLRRAAALGAALWPTAAAFTFIQSPLRQGVRQGDAVEPLAVGQASHDEVLNGQGMAYDELPMQASAGYARNCLSPSRTTRIADADDDDEVESSDSQDQYEVESSDPALGVPARWLKDTHYMKVLKESAWMDFKPRPYQEWTARDPKLAILMMAGKQVHNEDIWVKFLHRAKHDNLSVKMMIHAYGIDAGNRSQFLSTKLARYVVKDKEWSNWCNMWRPQMLLLKLALMDENVTHMMMVSEDSIPVKPLRLIYDALLVDPTTRMCADDRWRRDWPRAESWWLMRREDAELFAINEDFAQKNFLAHCTEEQAWYWPLRMRVEKWGNKLHNECPMFTNWMDGKTPCKIWKWNIQLCTDCQALRASPHHDAGFMHPVTYKSVNFTALKGLILSPFWFARKFEDGAVTPEAGQFIR